MLTINQAVPTFKIKAFWQNKIVDLDYSQFKDKWLVLLFCPADFSYVCPTELAEAADFYQEFKKEGAEMASLSTDSAFVHQAWHEQSPLVKKSPISHTGRPGR